MPRDAPQREANHVAAQEAAPEAEERLVARARAILVERWPWTLAGLAAVIALIIWAFSGGSEGPRYRLAQITRGDVQAEVNATGTLNAVVTVAVGSQLSGQLSQLYVDFNETVNQGDPLAQVDPETFAARVDEARAAVEIAEAQARIREAAVDRARADLESMRGKVAMVEARAASAEARLVEAQAERKRKAALVKKGSVSARQGEAAEADFKAAKATVDEVEGEAHSQKAALAAATSGVEIAEAELANAQGEVKRARAVLRQAEADLTRTIIRSPIDGIVIGRNVDKGQTVAASLEAPTLFMIAQDLHQMEVHAKLDEADIGLIERDQAVTFTVDAYPDRTFEGRVVQIRKSPERVNNVVTYTVVISAQNPDLALLPGMTATVRIVVGEASSALLVPNAALRFHPPGQELEEADRQPSAHSGDGTAAAPREPGRAGRVWVLGEDDGPEPVDLRIGVADQRVSEMISGPLEEGRSVIVGIDHEAGR